MESRRDDFFRQVLPDFLHQVELLGITKTELKHLITKLENNENK